MTFIGFLKLMAGSFVAFLKDGGMMLAASISFFAMTAMVPFCILLVAIFGHILGEGKDFYQFFLSKLVSFFPDVTSGITKELGNLITFSGISHFSIALYALLSYQLFFSLETATNVIFKIRVKRSFIVSLFFSVALITIIIAFFILSFSATTAVSMMKPLKDIFPALELGKLMRFIIGYVIPFILMFFTVATLYILLPRKFVKGKHALAGALLTAVLLEVAKHLFTLYVLNVFRLGTIYGPLSAFVIFLLWVYYSSSIFLIGAEMVHILGEKKEG